jgi:hypothetical protein
MATRQWRTVRTMCPMSCHPTLCGMVVEVEDGHLGVRMRDGWEGLNRVTSGDPVLPDAAVEPTGFAAAQARYAAFVEVVPV